MCRNLSRSWMAAALLFLSTLPAGAGYSSWTAQGPEGASVFSLVAAGSPPALYAGVSGDVLKSLDGGWTWRPSSQGLLQPETLWAHWNFQLAVDPTDPETLYTGGVDGIYKTTDSGETWSLLGNPGDIRYVERVAVSPAAPRTVWAMSQLDGLHVSRNAGASWSHVQGGFPTGHGEVLYSWQIIPDPKQAGVIYANTSYGLFKSADDGAHWRWILDSWYVVVDPTHPSWLYAETAQGFLRSVDGGNTWTRLINQIGSGSVCALTIDPRTSDFYAATPSINGAMRIYKSTDGGTTWTEGGRSPYVAWAYTFAFDPRQPSAVFLGSYAGVWKSNDRGRTWVPASRGMSSMLMESIAVDPSNPRFVYAGSALAGAYRSTDRGETWASRSTGPDAWYVQALLVAPFEPATVFAGTERGVFRSRNGARTWSRTGLWSDVNRLALEPAPPYTLYAATGEGLFRSTDRGDTWSLAWTADAGLASRVWHVAVSPGRPSEVFLTTASGLFFSADRGETWNRRPFESGSPVLVVIDPHRPSTLYVSAAPEDNGGATLFKSTDAGVTWKPASTGLPPDWILDLVIDPAHPNILYAAVNSSVFWTHDGGETWAPLAEDLPSEIQAMALDPTGSSTLHAATWGAGVFELTRITPPPPGDFLTTNAFPGFRFKVRLTEPGQPGVVGRQEVNCIPHALCVSGKIRHRTDVLLRVDGPLPDGSFVVTVARLTRAQVEVWVERPATGDKRYYRLEAVPAGHPDTAALTGKFAFPSP